jgi:salicylate hydroxylase
MAEQPGPIEGKGSGGPEVIVVGAGMGGLGAALWLAATGCRVRVFEAAPELREVGAGVTLGPNATRVLRTGSVLDALAVRASRPEQQIVQSWEGEILLSAEPNAADSDPAGYLQVHRADLQQALAAALQRLAPGALRLGATVRSCDPDSASPRVTLNSGEQLSADIVIGADGIHSAVRSVLFEEEAPKFTEIVAYRGLVPREHVPALESASPSGLTIGPGRSFLRYMIRAGEILNYVAFVKTPHWEQEGWSVACERSELEAHFEGAHSDVRAVIASTPGTMLHKWGLFLRQPLTRWTRGRVTLLGDAAHPMLPFLGQGASMALEDGCILARAIAGSPDIDTALATYERLRVPRANGIAAASAARAEAIHSGKPQVFGQQVADGGAASREQLFGYDAPRLDLSAEAA